MEEENILYRIKKLEKLIFRSIIVDNSNLSSDIIHMNKPTPTQMQIMEYIIKNRDKKVYQKDFEEILNLRRATVSGVLQTMEKNNLIVRVVDNEDTRLKKVLLTGKTKEIFENNNKKIQELDKIIIKNISKEDLKNFMKVIELMENNMQNYIKLKGGVKK